MVSEPSFADVIRGLLLEKYTPSYLQVEDESWKHAGHAQARQTGGGHYRVVVVSQFFKGMSRVERHQAVYQTLSFGQTNQIHALSIQAWTEEEWLKTKKEFPAR